MHRVLSARANQDFSLDLRFDDGREAHVDISDVMRSAIAEPFREPSRFVAALVLMENGEILRWDEQLELHADSLRYRAFPDELRQDYGPDPSGSRPAAE